jgi:hypothetical protein
MDGDGGIGHDIFFPNKQTRNHNRAEHIATRVDQDCSVSAQRTVSQESRSSECRSDNPNRGV